jgi:hypothetical protein
MTEMVTAGVRFLEQELILESSQRKTHGGREETMAVDLGKEPKRYANKETLYQPHIQSLKEEGRINDFDWKERIMDLLSDKHPKKNFHLKPSLPKESRKTQLLNIVNGTP